MDQDILENQWRSLTSMNLLDICPNLEYSYDISSVDVYYFWGCLLSYKNSAGDKPFEVLANFALKCLTLPISNAVIERIFSFMAAIKTKQRNRMQIIMLSSLLRLRVHLNVSC